MQVPDYFLQKGDHYFSSTFKVLERYVALASKILMH